jgi:antitoxin (DNA-binding transcriptional repressor) of toxin-antitoxin stability system
MAEYTQPHLVDRRLRYFDGQFLREQDFIDEQHYHLDRERRLARIAHSPGVVEGLAVTAVPNAPKVTVAAGTALDGRGQLLVRVDAGEPLDLTHRVDREGPVAVLVALAYAELEADAPAGGASPRWREAPEVTEFLEHDPDAPAAEDAPRLARVTVHPEGTVGVDRDWAAAPSGLAVGGALRVTGPASFPGGVDGGPAADDGSAPVVARADLQVTRASGYDGTVRLDVTNGATDFGRSNIVLTGRFQEGNDRWIFGTAARTSLVFSRNAAAAGEAVGAVGEEQVSLQLEGNSRALGLLTRARGADPALVVTQGGDVGVHTDSPGAALDVAGDLAVRAGTAFGEVGRWTARIDRASTQLQITITPGSRRNIIVVRRAAGDAGVFTVFVPDGTQGQWLTRFTAYDNTTGKFGSTLSMTEGFPLFGNVQALGMPPGSVPYVLVLEVHQVTTVPG